MQASKQIRADDCGKGHRQKRTRISWFGTVCPDIDDLVIVPRPVNGRIPIWLGTGGSAPSNVRAGRLGLPISYGIIGGIPSRFGRLAQLYREPFAYYVAGPDEIADRIVDLHKHLGHMRHFFQMDIGGLPHEYFLQAITILGTELKPRVARLLAAR